MVVVAATALPSSSTTFRCDVPWSSTNPRSFLLQSGMDKIMDKLMDRIMDKLMNRIMDKLMDRIMDKMFYIIHSETFYL